MILFLDFDGVLHPHPVFDESNLFRNLPRLEAILRQHPHVEIVISSSWRFDKNLTELRALFSADIAPRVIGVTPKWTEWEHLLDLFGSGCDRQAEIEGWLQESGRAGEPWVALDDWPEIFRRGCPNLVICHSHVGLDELVAEILVKKLGG